MSCSIGPHPTILLTVEQVIHCDLPAHGLLAPFFGKRDAVYERTWRAEEDGTYVVTMSSVEHPLCPPPKQKSGLGWFTSPVRAEVVTLSVDMATSLAGDLRKRIARAQLFQLSQLSAVMKFWCQAFVFCMDEVQTSRNLS